MPMKYVMTKKQASRAKTMVGRAALGKNTRMKFRIRLSRRACAVNR